MNREKIDTFLKYIAQIVKENPKINLNNKNDFDFIYSTIIHTGVDKNELALNTTPMFNEWINYFKNKPNINVFVSETWKYFCQFTNKDEKAKTHIKIYIPTKYSYLENNTKIIFDYLSKNNIRHLSKINKSIRFDNIVIRLSNKEDAINLLNFIQSNESIQKGLIAPNPFAFNYNNIAMACDGNNSYNSCVSCYIGLYMREKRNKNELDNISVNDFIKFVLNYYKEKFVFKNDMSSTINDFRYISEESFYNDLLDLKNITELFLKAYDGMNIDEYFEHFNKTNDINYRNIEINKLKNKPIDNDSNIENANKTLLSIYDRLKEFYDKNEVLEILTDYFRDDNDKYLTRRHNIRNDAVNSKLRDILYPILTERNITLPDYINILLNEINSKKIEKFFKIGKIKYGKEETINRLIYFLHFGDSKLITRVGNMRDAFMQDDFLDRTKSNLTRKSIDLSKYYGYFEKIYDNIINNEKEDSRTK